MVKITEELLQKADQIPNFSDGVIMPDGDYRLIEEKGHLQTMMALLPYPEKEIWKMIPENDSALFWMIEKTGCVLTDYNSTVGMVMTRSQKEVFDALVARGIFRRSILILPGRGRRCGIRASRVALYLKRKQNRIVEVYKFENCCTI